MPWPGKASQSHNTWLWRFGTESEGDCKADSRQEPGRFDVVSKTEVHPHSGRHLQANSSLSEAGIQVFGESNRDQCQNHCHFLLFAREPKLHALDQPNNAFGGFADLVHESPNSNILWHRVSALALPDPYSPHKAPNPLRVYLVQRIPDWNPNMFAAHAQD